MSLGERPAEHRQGRGDQLGGIIDSPASKGCSLPRSSVPLPAGVCARSGSPECGRLDFEGRSCDSFQAAGVNPSAHLETLRNAGAFGRPSGADFRGAGEVLRVIYSWLGGEAVLGFSIRAGSVLWWLSGSEGRGLGNVSEAGGQPPSRGLEKSLSLCSLMSAVVLRTSIWVGYASKKLHGAFSRVRGSGQNYSFIPYPQVIHLLNLQCGRAATGCQALRQMLRVQHEQDRQAVSAPRELTSYWGMPRAQTRT